MPIANASSDVRVTADRPLSVVNILVCCNSSLRSYRSATDPVGQNAGGAVRRSLRGLSSLLRHRARSMKSCVAWSIISDETTTRIVVYRSSTISPKQEIRLAVVFQQGDQQFGADWATNPRRITIRLRYRRQLYVT